MHSAVVAARGQAKRWGGACPEACASFTEFTPSYTCSLDQSQHPLCCKATDKVIMRVASLPKQWIAMRHAITEMCINWTIPVHHTFFNDPLPGVT